MSGDRLDELRRCAEAWGEKNDESVYAKIGSYLRFVQERNNDVNLTADPEWDDLALKHGSDGIFAASVLRPLLPPNPKILDLGSGAGFIGIVLKIVWPEAEVTLMESVERKYRFLSAAASRTGLQGLRVLHARAGAGAPLTSYQKDRDCVIERALAELPEAVRLSWPMLGPRGLFAAFQSEEPDVASPALAKSLSAAGGTLLKSVPYRRPREERERRLVIFGRRRD